MKGLSHSAARWFAISALAMVATEPAFADPGGTRPVARQHATAQAAAQPRAGATLQVRRVITATADVRDMVLSAGRVLLATQGGLVVRRDGHVVRVLGVRDGLPGARLRSVSLTADGLFVGGVQGAALLRSKDLSLVRTLPLRRVTRVVRFGGALWAGTWGGGLYRMAGPTARPKRVRLGRSPAFMEVTDLAVHDGALWVATAGAGIAVVDGSGHVTKRYIRSLADRTVFTFATEGDHLVAGTLGGISVFGPHGLDRRAHEAVAAARLPVRDVRALLPTRQALWVATFGAGVFRIVHGRTRPIHVRGAGVSRAFSLLAAEGGVLVGHEGGLARSVAHGRLAALTAGGLPSSDLTCLARAFGSLYIGTFEHGLVHLRHGRIIDDPGTGHVHLERRINDLAVTRDRKGHERLWIATDRGVWRYDGRVFSRVTAPAAPGEEHVSALHVDRHEVLWVAASDGLSRYAHGRWQTWTGNASVPVTQLDAVTTDSHGRVWVGSLHGLLRFDPSTRRFARYTVSSGALPVDWVTAVRRWGSGIVAGTYNAGLSWYDGKRFHIERKGRKGLPAGWVNPHAMRVLNGVLWIGTQARGLMVGSSGAWHRLRAAEGLPSNDVTAVLPAQSGAWIATRGGLAFVVRSRGSPAR